ncbi:MAG TPA: DUF5330 domain-containing protein [Pseudolabrys sp.]|nr:DUF5330 domain-containing protein [Pseudolabrys sp.]
MFFLLRMAFWLAIVCMLLPGSKQASPEAQIDPTQAMTLAGAAVSDMRGFCDRQPDACKAGGKVAVALGHKAEAGALTLYEIVSTKMKDKAAAQKTAKADTKADAKTVSVSAADRGTLTQSDVAPAWHGRVPLPPRRADRNTRPSA